MTRRLEVVPKVTEGKATSLTITDERITVKVFTGHDTDEMTQFAVRIADQIPLGTKALRGRLQPSGRTYLRFKRGRKFGYVYGKGSN